jgi:hypothetical protein
MSPPRLMVVALTLILASLPVSAQDQDRVSFVPEVVKKVFLDPTTYAPAAVAWKAKRLDWRSSQILRNGWFDHNPGLTVSGRGDDTAIARAMGNRPILTDALANLRVSLVNNVSERLMERLLMPRFSKHRKLIRTIGWIERSAMASYWSYRLSAGHFRQWQENGRRARQLGFN